jgi:hypothetical protein
MARLRQSAAGCYRTMLNERLPESEKGSIRFALTLGPDGAVTAVSATGAGGLDEEMLRCARAQLGAGRFLPPAGGSATIAGSFTFENSARTKPPGSP